MISRKTTIRVRAAPIRARIKRGTLPTMIAINIAIKMARARIWLNSNIYLKAPLLSNKQTRQKNSGIIAKPLRLVKEVTSQAMAYP